MSVDLVSKRVNKMMPWFQQCLSALIEIHVILFSGKRTLAALYYHVTMHVAISWHVLVPPVGWVGIPMEQDGTTSVYIMVYTEPEHTWTAGPSTEAGVSYAYRFLRNLP